MVSAGAFNGCTSGGGPATATLTGASSKPHDPYDPYDPHFAMACSERGDVQIAPGLRQMKAIDPN